MSKETAKKLIAEYQTNEELKAKVAGITDRDELLKIANAEGYDVTQEEFEQAEREFKRERAKETDEKLSFDDLEAVAGGFCGANEDYVDGHEIGCNKCYYTWEQYAKKGITCVSEHYTQKDLDEWNHPSWRMGSE